MSNINNQALANPIALSDQIILWSSANGDTRRASITSLLTLLEANIVIDPVTLSGNPPYYLPFVGGTPNAVTAAPGVGVALPALAAGQSFEFLPTSNNTAATTLTIGAFATKNVSINGANCTGGEFVAGVAVILMYDGVGLQIVGTGSLVTRTGAEILTRKILAGPSITGQAFAADGTAPLPAYSFTTDPDTGLYRIGANNVGVAVNGAKVLDVATTGLGITGGASVTGLLDISAAGAGQIKFPAAQNPSADPNTLDDYEEGTWTPSLGGTATYSQQAGAYTKIGNLCSLHWDLGCTLLGTGSTTAISGVPFTSIAAPLGVRFTGGMSYWNTLAVSVISLYPFIGLSAVVLGFFMSAASSISGTDGPALYGNGARTIGSTTYRTT